jgi:cell shape-determining protein MreD
MIYIFYIGICLVLIILQTTMLSNLPLFDRFYDLLIPFIIHLGLYRTVREGLILSCFLGLIMDNLSGSPFGLYLSTYCWLFIGIKWTIRYVQVANKILLSLVVIAGVFLENLIFLAASSIVGPGLIIGTDTIRTIAFQLIWALASGPLFLMIFRYLQQWFDNRVSGLFTRRNPAGL